LKRRAICTIEHPYDRISNIAKQTLGKAEEYSGEQAPKKAEDAAIGSLIAPIAPIALLSITVFSNSSVAVEDVLWTN
jgi:hypothetical protein